MRPARFRGMFADVHEADHARLKQHLAAAKISISEYLRSLISDDLEEAGLAPLIPKPPKRHTGVPPRPLDELHGTITGYTTRGCRCDRCRRAWREYRRRWVREGATGGVAGSQRNRAAMRRDAALIP